MLKELVMISESLPEGEAQRARANYKLSIILETMGREAESEEYRKKAIDLRAKIRPDDDATASKEESFSELCPWMLW